MTVLEQLGAFVSGGIGARAAAQAQEVLALHVSDSVAAWVRRRTDSGIAVAGSQPHGAVRSRPILHSTSRSIARAFA
jgi:hypothetical protein